MLRPSVGELLCGIRAGLETSVLPVVTQEGPMRQLRAAIQLLQRLELSWDRLPTYLAEDNDDIRSVLNQVFAATLKIAGSSAGQWNDLKLRYASQASAEVEPAAKIRDPFTSNLASINMTLQQLLGDVDTFLRDESKATGETRAEGLSLLDALYPRMVDRELIAWGTQDKCND